MAVEHIDVIVVGAGLSGICMAHYLKKDCPKKSFAILEGRERLGGTWDLFKYPGVRSDSDMSTLGYRFRPWKEDQQIADGPSILKYIHETAKEDGTYDKIRFNNRLVKAEWSANHKKWTLTISDTKANQTKSLTCNFLISCTGYYNYDKGYTPDFKGINDYKGQFIHPQLWPEDLDYKGKKVIVIGSGATAVTLVPAMAKEGAGHVTMLQRSPTYFISMPQKDRLANFLRFLPDSMVYPLVRWKNIAISLYSYGFSKASPKKMKQFLIGEVKKMLPEGYDVEKHFTPSYNPWEQRLCLVPDGDFFKEIKKGRTSVVTDHIDYFNDKGIVLKSGETLEADIIISATGLVIMPFGGVEVEVDGKPFDLSKSYAYKGTMISDMPNFGLILGYTNASWTLKADLSAEYLCKFINHIDKKGYSYGIPTYKLEGKGTQIMTELESGYINRAKDLLPYNGIKKPWKVDQNYIKDILLFRYGKMVDGHIDFK